MNILLRLVPLIIGLGVGFFMTRFAFQLEKPMAYPIFFMGTLTLIYFFTIYNIWMKKRTVEIVTYKDIEPNHLAHILNILSSAIATYSVLEHHNFILVLVIIAMFYADELLTHRKKKIEISNTLDSSLTVENIDNKSLIDTIKTTRKNITQIAQYAKENNFDKIKIYDTKKITQGLTYKENKEEYFLVLGELERDSKIQYLAHEKLFFLINDINALELLFTIPNFQESMLEEYQYRILINAIYLEHYFYVLEENIVKKTMPNILKNEKTIRKINYIASLYYGITIQRLNQTNHFFSSKNIEAKNKIDEIPQLPVGIATILDGNSELLNIYMPKEMAKALKNWMASIQATAMTKQQ